MGQDRRIMGQDRRILVIIAEPQNARKIGRPSSFLLFHNSSVFYLFLSAVRTYPGSYSLNGNFTRICENDAKSETISYFHPRSCCMSAYMLLRTWFGVLVRFERGSLYAEYPLMLCNLLYCPLYKSSHNSKAQFRRNVQQNPSQNCRRIQVTIVYQSK